MCFGKTERRSSRVAARPTTNNIADRVRIVAWINAKGKKPFRRCRPPAPSGLQHGTSVAPCGGPPRALHKTLSRHSKFDRSNSESGSEGEVALAGCEVRFPRSRRKQRLRKIGAGKKSAGEIDCLPNSLICFEVSRLTIWLRRATILMSGSLHCDIQALRAFLSLM
jgi:hypothetical protein